jgi:DNA-binding NarL/FixJ family response regulator
LFLEGLQYLLKTHRIDVAGTAATGREALIKARELRPDIILMDIRMPECDGIDALKLINYEMPDIKILMLTTSEEDDDIYNAIKFGAFGYLMKNINAEDLINLLSGIENGEIALPFGVAEKILNELREYNTYDKPAASSQDTLDSQDTLNAQDTQDLQESLTPRHLEILELVARGITYKEAAEKLGLTERTVKYHMGRIIELLHLKNRSQVIAYAVRMGLTKE